MARSGGDGRLTDTTTTSGARPARFARVLALACALALASPAGATDDEGAPPPADGEESPPAGPLIVPPRLEEAVILPYPEDAPRGEGTVEVAVRLAINGLGEYVAAEIDQGAGEPFDGFALDAVRHLRFAPATVDGIPTAVTVVLPIRFVLPPEAPPPPPSGVLVGKIREAGSRRVLTEVLLTMTPAAPGQAPDRVIEVHPDRAGGFRFIDVPVGVWKVTITGHGVQSTSFTEEIEADLLRQVVYRVAPTETGSRTVIRVRRTPPTASERVVEGEWIRGAAGSSGGFLRVLESEAPVAPTPVLPTGLLPGAPLIRGVEGSDSVVLVDGIETPLLYHFGLLTTVVNGDLIDHVRLTPGGAGADRGDHVGGVVDVGMRPPRSDRFGGIVDISPIDATFLLETPIGKPVGVYAAVRRSYVDLYLGKLLPEDMPAEVTAMPVYTDLAAMVNVDPGKGHRAAVSLITSSDKMELSQVNASGTTPLAALEAAFTLVHGFWRSPPGGKWEGNASLAYEHIKSGYTAFPDLYLDTQEKRVVFAAGFGAQLAPVARLQGGLQVQRRMLTYGENFYSLPREDEPGLINPYATSADESYLEAPMTEVGIHAQAPLTPRKGLRIVPGVRLNHWSEATRWTADPRLAARWDPDRKWQLRSAAGVYHQVPSLEDLVQAGLQAQLLPEAAFQWTGGATFRPLPPVEIGLDLYVTSLWNLVVADASDYEQALHGSLTDLELEDGQPLSNSGVGRIAGAELSLRWRPLGRVDCLLAYTIAHSERRDHEDEAWRLFQYDRPHQLTVAGQVKAPHDWSFGLRFRLASGAPDTPITDVLYLADMGGYVPRWGLPYSQRLKPFHQLDWRVQKMFRLPAFVLLVYLDVENTYYARRDDVLIYNRDFSERLTFAMIPLFRLGLRAEF